MRIFCRSRHPAALPFACAAAFIAIGLSQASFLGVGMAFLGLALAALGRRSAS